MGGFFLIRWPVIVPAGTKQDLQVLHDESFTSLNDAWQFLLEHGKSLADAHKLKAEDLVLGMYACYRLQDYSCEVFIFLQ